MRLVDELKDGALARAILDPANPRLVVGSEEERAEARREWHQARFTREVFNSKLPEIPRSSLEPVRGLRRYLEDVASPDGDFYVVHGGASVDLTYAKSIVAYFVDAAGIPVLLERPTGVKSRAELEQRRAEREQRRKAPKPRRQKRR